MHEEWGLGLGLEAGHGRAGRSGAIRWLWVQAAGVPGRRTRATGDLTLSPCLGLPRDGPAWAGGLAVWDGSPNIPLAGLPRCLWLRGEPCRVRSSECGKVSESATLCLT